MQKGNEVNIRVQSILDTRRVVLLLLSLLVPVTACAQAVQPVFQDALTRQQKIYQSRGDAKPEGYVIDRGLNFYASSLPPGFARDLERLGPEGRWLDIGAGQGQAILDYFDPAYGAKGAAGQPLPLRRGKAVAMSIEDRRTLYWHQAAERLEAGTLRYVFGKSLREYAPDDLGQFQIITDFLGGFSYTTSLSLFMEKVLGLLAVNGSFYSVLQDIHSEGTDNKPYYPDSRFLTEIADASGAELKVCAWLKRITCVEVSCDFKSDWKPPIETYHVRKLCNEVSVPDLTLTHFDAGTPPERQFRFDAAQPAALKTR